jgi:hypothetical protein
MDALAGRLAGLRITGNDHLVAESLNQDLVFVAFLEDVADRVLGEGASGDQALLAALDGHKGGSWHGEAPSAWMDECPERFKQNTCQVIKMFVLQ